METRLLRGSQRPTRLVKADGVSSRFGELESFVNIGGFEFLDWQRLVVSSWLGTDEFGKWSARSCGEHVPRQNGKTLGTTVPRMNWGACCLNELVLYTSHLQKTSTETFEDVASFFDQRKFRKYIKAIRTALGREAVEFKSGGKIKFLARTRNGGRGQHADLLVFDEDQELTDEQQASFLPCLAASSNPQILYTGTPPDENAPGDVARRIRERALSGAPGISYAEWSVEEIGDVNDRSRWYMTNPSMGYLIQEDTVETESIDMSADKFARERLGWWSPTDKLVEHAIKEADWNACKTDEPPADGLMAIGIKFSPDGSSMAMSVCLKPSDGVPYIEVIKACSTARGTAWLASWLMERKDKIAVVCIDGKRGESTIQKLNDERFPKKAIEVPKSADVAKACSMLVDAVESGAIEHYGQPDLDASATLTSKRRIGQDGFGFDSTEQADATLIESCALAYRAALTTKRRPGRKAVVY